MMRKLVRMTGWIFLSWAFMSCVAPVPFAASQASSPSDQAQVLGSARLSLIQGDVAIQTRDTGDEWGAASINTPVTPGTRVWVPENARTEIQFIGGSYLRAGENTDVDFTDLKIDSQDNVTQVVVPQGRTYIHYRGSNVKDSVFQVDSPVASTRAYGASKFKVEVYEDGYTEVSVITGAVYVEAQTGSTKVDPGSMLSIGAEQNAELSPIRVADSWDQWNQLRDSALARAGASREYLPPTLDAYRSDFDTYGHWVSTADYGYVWTPTVTVATWSPYRIGRWCWIGGDYVWVSYEPWGWVPYHYGRWAFIATVGWCWVPPHRTAVYWSPGFVAWVHTPTYVAWVPLAPGETYYGRGYHGPHSVNITNININKIRVTNVHVNAKFVNAVTVVNRETFLTGKSVKVVDPPRNPFAAGTKVSIGRPDIKPVRTTTFPNPTKVISQGKLPSREIATRSEKIRNRPIATGKDVSVFKPGEQVRSMPVDKLDRPKPVTRVKKPEMEQPPVRRGEGREAGPPPAQGRQRGGPSPQREFGVSPQHKGEPQSSPPARRQEMNRPSAPGTATPQTQRPQSSIPKREQMGTPPARPREAGPPSAQGRQRGGPSSQREFGVAPQHQGQSGTPPVQRKELSPSGQMRRPTPPTTRREPSPSPQMSRPASPAPRSSSGPSVQRNTGVAPPHVGRPSAPAAPSGPQGVDPGTPSKGVKDEDRR